MLKFALLAAALVVLIGGGVHLLLPGDPNDGDPLAVHAPELTPEFRAFLAIEDEAEFDRAAVEMGEPRLTTLWVALVDRARLGEPGALAAIEPAAARIARAFADHYDTRLRLIELDDLRRTSLDDQARYYAIRHELYAMNSGGTQPDSIKVRRLNAMIEEARTIRADSTALEILSTLGRVYADLGNPEASRLSFEEALKVSWKRDNPWMTCQILGTLAQIHFEEGRIDSAYAKLDRAEHRARRSKLAAQTARILAFRASFTRDSGNYGAAYTLLQEARRTCREFKGGSRETRFVLAELELLERLGCWRLSSDLLDEAMVLFDMPSYEAKSFDTALKRRRLQLAEARSLFEIDQEKGLEMYGEAVRAMTPRPYREQYAEAMLQYASMLLRAGRLAEAEQTADEGLFQTRRDRLTADEARFELMLARVDWAAGKVVSARTHLLAHRGIRPENLFSQLDDVAAAAALDIRLTADLSGDGPELAAAIQRSFGDMSEAMCKRAPSVANYLALDVFDDMRWAIHDRLEDDPALGYHFDLKWRRLARDPDAGSSLSSGRSPSLSSAAACISAWCGYGQEAKAPHSPLDAEHLLYLAQGDRMIRWHASDSGIRRVVLGASKQTLAELVMSVAAEVSSPSRTDDESARARLYQTLLTLTKELLPDSLRLTPPARLMVSADDMLELLPFGILIGGRDGNRPLAMASDIVRLRYKSDQAPRSPGRPFVLANPLITPELRRLHPGLVDLPGSEREGRKVVERWRGARVLSGAAATKRAVLEAIAGASEIYCATHIVQSARAPFLKFIPLASDAEFPQLENSLLEMRDILALDLSSCRLVILAGCFSGTPYVTGTRLAPGFGDVFLDAGARCAVQNLWLVEDESMVKLMESFTASSDLEDDVWDFAANLRRAKTELIDEAGGRLHPFYWGGLTLVSSDPGR